MNTEPQFISRQTVDASRFYLDLDPPTDATLAVVCGGVERVHTDYCIDRSNFPYFGLELVAEGTGTVWLDGHEYHLSPGTAFAYGPNVAHRIRNDSAIGMRKYYLDFVGTESVQLLSESGLLGGRPVMLQSVIEVSELLDSIAREAIEHSPISVKICPLLTRILLLKVQQRTVSEGDRIPTGFRTYETVRKYIDEHYLDVTTIESVARACDMTATHVSRLFRKYSDTSASLLLRRKRMHFAAQLLIEDRLMVREVADRLGFADAFQFSRAFKQIYGIAPSKLKLQDYRSSDG
ncbi:MAG: AraC family transcriptional regulator [Planctomycetota bacterium]